MTPSATLGMDPGLFGLLCLRALLCFYSAQPYWVHRLFEAVFALIPIKMALRLTHSRMISTRARIIASAERYQKKLREQQNSTSPRPIQETA